MDKWQIDKVNELYQQIDQLQAQVITRDNQQELLIKRLDDIDCKLQQLVDREQTTKTTRSKGK
jgi:hypothetical protein